MEPFEELLAEHHTAVERFVRFRLPAEAEIEDVLQDIYLTAYQNFDELRNTTSFKAWIISIARNKCNDWFRKMTKCLELSVDEVPEKELSYGRYGIMENAVQDVLGLLSNKD